MAMAAAAMAKSTRALGGQKITNKPAPQAVADEGERARRPAQPMSERQFARRPSASSTAGTVSTRPLSSSGVPAAATHRGTSQPKLVVILAKAGLKIGYDGLVDAYDRAGTTTISVPHLTPYRPDIVHQCLLALFDSDMAAAGRLQVFIVTTFGKTIEVNPSLRPPRTYARFRGLMEKLLQEGMVKSADGQWLMRTTRWSIAPQIPHGAEVYGIHNAESSPVVSAAELGRGAAAEPVSDALQGGMKNVLGFYCISCTDDSNLDGLDFVTQTICLSKYPTTPHVACLRIAEGFRLATSAQTNTVGAEKDPSQALATALQTPGLGQKRLRA